MQAFVLAKNEAANISACLHALRCLQIPVVVLDSGSTDETREIAQLIPSVQVESFGYTTHMEAYNYITTIRTGKDQWALVLDADMQISASLYEELLQRESENQWDVIVAPILMFSEGRPLTYGSLCPPKAIFFRGKASHFEPCGHGERIIAGTRVASVRNTLIHDDRKPYSQYLLTQLRYANSLRARSTEGKLTWRDRIRLRWPLLAIVVPMYSFILKLGFLSGSVGIIYAIDRAVAELLQYRQALASSLHDDDRQTVMDQQNNYLKS